MHTKVDTHSTQAGSESSPKASFEQTSRAHLRVLCELMSSYIPSVVYLVGTYVCEKM